MATMAIYSVTIVVLERNRISSLQSHMERRWKRDVVSRVSSVIVVIRLGKRKLSVSVPYHLQYTWLTTAAQACRVYIKNVSNHIHT